MANLGPDAPLPPLPESPPGMRPCDAARRRNLHTSPLYTLPPELTTLIVKCLADDWPSLTCLRKVSIRLRQSVDNEHEHAQLPLPSTNIAADERLDLRTRLLRDIKCEACLSRHVMPEERQKEQFRPGRTMHCSGCVAHHPTRAFSPGERAKPAGIRVCIAREGFVRLCEHTTISRRDVEEWAADSRPARRIVCNHPNHSRDVGPGSPSEGAISDDIIAAFDKTLMPSAIFETGVYSDVMKLEWWAHQAITLDANDQLSVPELRAMFLRHRRTVRAWTYPLPESRTPGSLPEFMCFDPSRCDCLSHSGAQDPAAPSNAHQRWPSPFLAPGAKDCSHSHSTQLGSLGLDLYPCSWHDYPEGRTCVIARYHRRFILGSKWQLPYPDEVIIHAGWLRGMDPGSYAAVDFEPPYGRRGMLCKVPGCGNSLGGWDDPEMDTFIQPCDCKQGTEEI